MQCSDPDSNECGMTLVESSQSVAVVNLHRTADGNLLLCDRVIRSFKFVCKRCNRSYKVSTGAGPVVQFTEGTAS